MDKTLPRISSYSNHKETILGLFRQTSFPDNPENCVHNLFKDKKIIFYGAGHLGIAFLIRILWKYGFKAYAVIDRKFMPQDYYYGIPAFSSLEYKPTKEEKEKAIVVITVGKKEYYREIFNYLHNLGFKNIILATDIYEFQLVHTPIELEREGFKYYLKNKERIMECLDLFSDDLSREIYTRFIKIHMLRKPIEMPGHTINEQYFPRDIKLSKGYSRFINCGAFDGDTIKQLNTLFGKVESIVCFEPEQTNFELLTQYLCAEHNNIAQNVIAFPCGVFSHNAKLRFNSGVKEGGAILDKGNSFIQCVTLDSVLPGFQPTFINMDIEGAELEAIKGAERLVKDNKPDLAISVYHSPNHIWDIPLYIASLNLGYQFYLRSYSWFTNDTVVYATL